MRWGGPDHCRNHQRFRRRPAPEPACHRRRPAASRTYSNADAYWDANGYAYSHRDSYSHCNSNAYSNAYTYSDGNSNAYRNSDTDADTHLLPISDNYRHWRDCAWYYRHR